MDGITTLEQLLKFLVEGGALMFVSAVVSWLVEEFPFWQKLSSKVKSIIMFVLSTAVGIGALILMQNDEIVKMLDPYIRVILAIGGSWFVNQRAHVINPRRIT